jgi:hypothetical protein
VLAVIEWGKLAELLWAAPLAALVVSVSYSLLILGVSRVSESRRLGDNGSTAAFALLAVVSAAVFAATVVYAFILIIKK